MKKVCILSNWHTPPNNRVGKLGMVTRHLLANKFSWHINFHLKPCRWSDSRALARKEILTLVCAVDRANWNFLRISTGSWFLATLALLRPLRSLQYGQLLLLRRPKYFTFSGVSSVIAPSRGYRTCLFAPMKAVNPCVAYLSMTVNTLPMQVWSK